MDGARIWFHDGFGAPAGGGCVFVEPRRLIVARDVNAVRCALEQIRAATEAGYWAAGFLSYEAAPAFDPAFAVRDPACSLPLLWFGIFEAPHSAAANTRVECGASFIGNGSIRYPDYINRVQAIRDLIAAGDVYQVNFTYPLEGDAPDDPLALWRSLMDGGHGSYGAYIDIGSYAIASLSPELFFRQDGDAVETRPMKGTAARGRWIDEDAARAAGLRSSPKELAENLMIVDLLRNDLGRVAVPGTVRVSDLFRAERYATVWQLTSTIQARTAAHPVDTLAALFPCGSVTGAPKIRAMEIIAQLEAAPRGVYTGAIGWFGPGRRACFSVAIRTIEIDRMAGVARYGVGGGITWDSDPAAEWEETRRKAALLAPPRDAFGLFETMLWTPGEGYALLDRHLARLRASAEFFGIACDLDGAHRALAATWPEPRRIRLVLHRDGRFSLDSRPYDARTGKPWRVALAAEPVDENDARMFHKTTWREPFEQARASRPGFDDVLLFNTRGELTESTIANVAIERDGRLLTPARACGLLAGTMREQLLENHRILETTIPIESLIAGERVWLFNSVRGMFEAEIC
ncbi:aminodeoxychorismate synthase component I [bacterium]|nr:aminodeoxychorismate synthase component I [bacterium]